MTSSPAPTRPSARVTRAGRAHAVDLSPQRIVQVALALVADEGLAALSTRKLAARLGCEAMSIYHHFPNKHHLLDALVDHAIASIELPDPAAPPLKRLRLMLMSYREMAKRFAALYPLIAVHRLNTPTGARLIESVLELLAAVLPDAESTARHFRTLGYYITGAALDETAGYARGPSAAVPVDDAYIAAHCPRLTVCAPYFQPQHWQATYELGLEALLARVEADGAAVAAVRVRRTPRS